jgi:DNA-binding SARP family transcriptional activator
MTATYDQVPPVMFELLGPVRVWRAGRELPAGTPQQRAVLAILLLREGMVATVDELIAALWGDSSPVTAVSTVRTYVSRLRGTLGPDVTIDTYGDGYLLSTPGASVDLRRFRQLTGQARRAMSRDEPATAFRDLRAAVALHRGSPLAGAAGPFAEGQRHRLDELVRAARLDLHAAGLALGRHEETVPELTALAAEHPLWERVHELLMRALCQAGRQAEALMRYQALRERLADTLGIDPSRRLQHLHREILLADRPAALIGS